MIVFIHPSLNLASNLFSWFFDVMVMQLSQSDYFIKRTPNRLHRVSYLKLILIDPFFVHLQSRLLLEELDFVALTVEQRRPRCGGGTMRENRCAMPVACTSNYTMSIVL
jgi:hypothetical protein